MDGHLVLATDNTLTLSTGPKDIHFRESWPYLKIHLFIFSVYGFVSFYSIWEDYIKPQKRVSCKWSCTCSLPDLQGPDEVGSQLK